VKINEGVFEDVDDDDDTAISGDNRSFEQYGVNIITDTGQKINGKRTDEHDHIQRYLFHIVIYLIHLVRICLLELVTAAPCLWSRSISR